jgi:hypothetical protein
VRAKKINDAMKSRKKQIDADIRAKEEAAAALTGINQNNWHK